MQVPTNAFYDRSSRAMNTLSQRADLIQSQIATGKTLVVASQDVAGYQRLAGLKRDAADATAYDANLTLAGSVLAGADSTLDAVSTRLQRASELAIQARTGTQNDKSRAAIAAELDTIVDALVELGNTRDVRGEPLFGGADGAAAVTRNADGSFTFAAVAPSSIPIGNGQSVQASDTAARVFKKGDADILTQLTALSTALKAGGDVKDAVGDAIDQIAAAQDQVTTVHASLGARAARVELAQTQATAANTDREAVRSSIEDTDLTAAVTELQKTMTILSATQASFSKLSQLSLFDYLR